ncbi:MAG: hypothetical protein ABSE93_19765 [Terriglobia bacterium]|jgi:hypothetical protein
MVRLGISLALLSGISNGLFTAPMKVIPRWKRRRLPERPAPLAPYSKPGGLIALGADLVA